MSDAKGLIFDINENEIMSHIEDGTLSQFLKSWRNAQSIKLAKEQQEEPNIPLECVDGSCPIALSEEYEECGMDAVHSCAECPYQPQVQPIVRNVEEVAEELETIYDGGTHDKQYWIDWLTGKEV